MARFTDPELAAVKAIPLVDVCRDYGIELHSQGKDLSGKCPFHEDDSPSFVVSPGKNLWHCMGACGCGGDTIQLVMKKEGVSFRHACEKLRARLGVVPEPATITTRNGASHEILCTPEEAEERGGTLTCVMDFYHQTFLNNPAAMQYLQSRACFHPEAVNRFKLGYANRTLGYRLPDSNAAGKQLKATLQELGILRAKTGHEHLNGCVIFPIFDVKGAPVQMYGRRLMLGADPRHLYLSGPQRGVWNREALEPGGDWYVCEAIIDALTLWCHGWRSVTASYGVNGFTAEHLALVRERRPARVFICYDADTAGHAQAAVLAQELAALGLEVWRAAPFAGKDVNDMAVEAADPKEALSKMMKRAQKVSDRVVVPIATSSEKPEVSVPVAAALVNYPHASAPSFIAAELAAKKEAASPLAQATQDLEAGELSLVKQDPDEIVLASGERVYRVRGLYRNSGYEALKVSLRLSCGSSWHLDTLDMAQARQRAAFVQAASEETGIRPEVLKRDVGRVLLKLEQMQEARLRSQVAPEPVGPKMSETEREQALALLRDPRLIERILKDFAACGVVGEETNKLVGYIAAVSRKLSQPLAIVVQSTSAAGKTALMESVLAFVPQEERVKYSALTGQALFYLSDADLKHKVLAIVEEEGAEKASYALKLLQSEGELTIASTGKDPVSGRMTTQEYRVEGPVMIFLTTTAVDIDEELLNRCLVLTVDEGREQTAAIHRTQRRRETLDGMLQQEARAEVLAVHRNAQRLLRSLRVVNPYAERLTFLDDRTRTRRDHTKYLTLIRTIALLHQHQRPLKSAQQGGKVVEYIEATLEDIAVANTLAHHVLGRCLDEMPPQTRRLLGLIERMVFQKCEEQKIDRDNVRFRARELREFSGWGNTQLHLHLSRLAAMEYVLTHRAEHGNGFVYELVYDGGGKDGGRFLPGLLDVESLSHPGVNESHPALIRAVSGANPGCVRGGQNADSSSGIPAPKASEGKSAHQGPGADAA